MCVCIYIYIYIYVHTYIYRAGGGKEALARQVFAAQVADEPTCLLHDACRSNLQSNNISDEGAKALAEALKVNTALQHLTLTYNNISDAVEQQIKTDKRIRTAEDR